MDDVTLRSPKYAFVIALILLLGCAVAAVGFLLGRDSVVQADAHAGDAAAKHAAYHEGVKAGRRAATPERTYADGLEAGRQRGLATGYAQGADAALGDGRFDLAAGGYYIVRFATGERGADLQLERSAAVVPGRAYEVCSGDEICYR